MKCSSLNLRLQTQQQWQKFFQFSHKPGIYRAQRTCEANPAGENSSFISTACVKSVALYHFKLEYVVLHMAVKE